MLEQSFKAADPKGNGHISLEEAGQVLGERFPAMEPELAKRVVQRYDQLISSQRIFIRVLA